MHKRHTLDQFGENLESIGQLVQKMHRKQVSRSSLPPSCFCRKGFLWVIYMKDKCCLNLVKIWHKSANWFKSYGKKSIETVDLASEQIALKEGRDGLGRLSLLMIKFASRWCKFGANRSIGSRDMAKTVLHSLRTDRSEGGTRRPC